MALLIFLQLVEIWMQCTNCAAEVPVRKKFCGQCGAAVARRCPACGAANLVPNKFCGDCGTKLRGDSPAGGQTGRDSGPVERGQVTGPFWGLAGLNALSPR